MDIPAEHQKPFWHASHWSALLRRSALPAVPAAQSVGAELPSPHHEDSGQSRQAVAPLASCQLPAGQRRQVPRPSVAAYDPGVHGWHADALLLPGTGLALPASHVRHALTLEAPGLGL